MDISDQQESKPNFESNYLKAATIIEDTLFSEELDFQDQLVEFHSNTIDSKQFNTANKHYRAVNTHFSFNYLNTIKKPAFRNSIILIEQDDSLYGANEPNQSLLQSRIVHLPRVTKSKPSDKNVSVFQAVSEIIVDSLNASDPLRKQTICSMNKPLARNENANTKAVINNRLPLMNRLSNGHPGTIVKTSDLLSTSDLICDSILDNISFIKKDSSTTNKIIHDKPDEEPSERPLFYNRKYINNSKKSYHANISTTMKPPINMKTCTENIYITIEEFPKIDVKKSILMESDKITENICEVEAIVNSECEKNINLVDNRNMEIIENVSKNHLLNSKEISYYTENYILNRRDSSESITNGCFIGLISDNYSSKSNSISEKVEYLKDSIISTNLSKSKKASFHFFYNCTSNLLQHFSSTFKISTNISSNYVNLMDKSNIISPEVKVSMYVYNYSDLSPIQNNENLIKIETVSPNIRKRVHSYIFKNQINDVASIFSVNILLANTRSRIESIDIHDCDSRDEIVSNAYYNSFMFRKLLHLWYKQIIRGELYFQTLSILEGPLVKNSNCSVCPDLDKKCSGDHDGAVRPTLLSVVFGALSEMSVDKQRILEDEGPSSCALFSWQ